MNLKIQTDGLSECINDYIEGKLDKPTAEMFEKYLEKETALGVFVHRSQQGRMALQNMAEVKAADNFEKKLAARISENKAHTA